MKFQLRGYVRREVYERSYSFGCRECETGDRGAVRRCCCQGGKIIAACANTVTPDCDPTAHAEVNAIREACRKLDTFQLGGCEIYASCEPCPMCLGAIYWARPSRVYYASTKEDAALAGFDDSLIYKEIALPEADRSIPFLNEKEDTAGEEFSLWKENKDKTVY